MNGKQLTLPGIPDKVEVEGGPRTAPKRGRPGPSSCDLCKKYYSDWLRSLNIGKRTLLRKMHERHIHGDA